MKVKRLRESDVRACARANMRETGERERYEGEGRERGLVLTAGVVIFSQINAFVRDKNLLSLGRKRKREIFTLPRRARVRARERS